MKLAEILSYAPDTIWNLAAQCGLRYSIARLPVDQDGNPSVEYFDLLHLKNKHAGFGFEVQAIEPDLNWQMHKFNLGLKEGDEELDGGKGVIRKLGGIGVRVFGCM